MSEACAFSSTIRTQMEMACSSGGYSTRVDSTEGLRRSSEDNRDHQSVFARRGDEGLLVGCVNTSFVAIASFVSVALQCWVAEVTIVKSLSMHC